MLHAGTTRKAGTLHARESRHALLGLTRAYVALSDGAQALAYADKARAIAPADPRVLVARGVVLDMLQRHAEAQDSYRLVLAAAPHDIPARNDLALSLTMTGQYQEAVDILTPIAKSATATPRLRQNLALVYGLMGDMERAKALSQVDLDDKATAANLLFFDYVAKADQMDINATAESTPPH